MVKGWSGSASRVPTHPVAHVDEDGLEGIGVHPALVGHHRFVEITDQMLVGTSVL